MSGIAGKGLRPFVWHWSSGFMGEYRTKLVIDDGCFVGGNGESVAITTRGATPDESLCLSLRNDQNFFSSDFLSEVLSSSE